MPSPTSRSPPPPILTSSPAIATPATPTTPSTPHITTASRPRAQSLTSTLAESIFNARPPPGFCAATGEAFGRAPTLAELRRNSASSGEREKRRRSSVSVGSTLRRGSAGTLNGRRDSAASGTPGTPTGLAVGETIKERMSEDLPRPGERPVLGVELRAADEEVRRSRTLVEEEREEEITEEKEKPGWWAVTKHGLAAFWKWFLTPLGFAITIYMLNVVAWGGMLFLLLCNASPAMCTPTCNDINSPRRIWIEIDSQILNALFCVTGFGLIPWRFRDLYYLLKWRLGHNRNAYLKLQEIHSAWYRAGDGSGVAPEETGDAGVGKAVVKQREGEREEDREAIVAAAVNEDTITGRRGDPTKSWKLDYVVWLYCWNTFFQCCLSGFMWGMNRYDRPSWSTGLFVALACGVAGMAGGQVWWETRKVKRVEGDPKKEDEVKRGEEMKKERVKRVLEEEEVFGEKKVGV